MFIEVMLEAARKNLATVVADATMMDVAKLLVSGTDLIAVCNSDGVLTGVVTKSDVVNQISVYPHAASMCPISTMMTREVALCRASDRLEDVSKLMKERHLKNIPVVDERRRPIGVLTARAILRVLLSDAEYEEAQLFDYVKGVGYR